MEQHKIYKIYHNLLELLKNEDTLLFEFFIEFNVSNFSITSNSVELIFFNFFLI